jgi:hypothetical protein
MDSPTLLCLDSKDRRGAFKVPTASFALNVPCSTKVQAVVELIMRLRAEDSSNQVVVFSQWQKVGQQYERVL